MLYAFATGTVLLAAGISFFLHGPYITWAHGATFSFPLFVKIVDTVTDVHAPPPLPSSTQHRPLCNISTSRASACCLEGVVLWTLGWGSR